MLQVPAPKIDRRRGKKPFTGKKKGQGQLINMKAGFVTKAVTKKITYDQLLQQWDLERKNTERPFRQHRFQLDKCDWKSLGLSPRGSAQGVVPWLGMPENIEILLKLYVIGVSMQQLAQVLECHMLDVHRACSNNAQIYEIARRAKAQLQIETMEMDLAEVRNNTLDTDKAKVLTDGARWLAARFDRQGFGDRQQTELTGPGGGAIKIEPDEHAIARVMDKLLPGKIINQS